MKMAAIFLTFLLGTVCGQKLRTLCAQTNKCTKMRTLSNKCPKIQSTEDQRMLYIKSDLYSLDLNNFLKKFLIFYDSIQRKKIMQNYKLDGKVIRCLVTDLSFFTELDGFFSFFKLIDWLYIDIYCDHGEDYRNQIFIHNLIKSSLVI